MLGVGIDWAEEFHVVALGWPGEGVFDVRRVEHAPGAVQELIERIARLEPDPAEVRVVLETRHGLLVERLLEAGYVVLPVNPDLVARRRGPARKKDDAEDARIACLLALDRFARLRPLIPHGELAGELRAIARDDERAARDQRRLANRLRQDLIAAFPAAEHIAGADLAGTVFLRFLQRWPTAEDLVGVGREELVDFARDARHGWPERFAGRVLVALQAEHFTPRAYLVRAKRRHHPPARRAASGPGRPAQGLGTADGRVAVGRAPARAGQEGQPRRGGGAVPWRRDLPELSGPR